MGKYAQQAANINGQLATIKSTIDAAIEYFTSVGTSLPAPSNPKKDDMLSLCTRTAAADIVTNLTTISSLCQGIPGGLSAKARELDAAEEARLAAERAAANGENTGTRAEGSRSKDLNYIN